MKSALLVVVVLVAIASQVSGFCVDSYQNPPPPEIARNLTQKCMTISRNLVKEAQSQCFKSCLAYQYALEMPLCLSRESQMGRPVCHSVCVTFAKDCQSESDNIDLLAACPMDSSNRQCEMGPHHDAKEIDGASDSESRSKFLRRNAPQMVMGSSVNFGPILSTRWLNPPWNNGISGIPYPDVFCTGRNKCHNVTVTERFFCFNRVFGVEVPCTADQFDPVEDMCMIVKLEDPGCTTKDCVNQFRMQMSASGPYWECMDSQGHLKLCGGFQSGKDHFAVVEFTSMAMSGGEMNQYCQGAWDKCCQFNYDKWPNKPTNADDLAFKLF